MQTKQVGPKQGQASPKLSYYKEQDRAKLDQASPKLSYYKEQDRAKLGQGFT